MKQRNTLRKWLALGCTLSLGAWGMAQNVGVGTAAPSQKLHVSDATLPNAATVRVSGLSSTTTLAAGTAPFSAVMVDANGVMYRGGTTGAANNNAWFTLGNAGTAAATNFMGSTDAVDVVFRTNNTETFRMTSGQRVGIGIAAPTVKLEVSSGTGDAIFGHSNNVGAYLGYETNFSFGNPLQNISGAGVWASNPAAGYTSAFAQSSGSATVAANISYSNVWMATYNYVDNASATYNPSASYNQLNVTNGTLGGTQIALRGWNERGTTTGNPGYSVGVQGISDSQNQDAMGVQGIAWSSSGGISVGGYFEGLTYPGASIAYSYVAGWTNGATARKIVGTGSVSEIVPTANHGRVTLTAPESPEYFYQDYGTVNMVNGQAHVDLDPILADIIVVDASNPLRVFATPVNMLQFNGVTIMNQTATGFDLVELNGGNHSGQLHYQIVCKPKTNFGEGRFPQAPGPSYVKADREPAAAKAANQPTYNNVFHWPADHVQYGYDPADMVGPGDRVPAGPMAGKIKIADGQFMDYVPAQKPQ